MNKREFNKELIRNAVRKALKDLKKSGTKITKAEVIRNSVYENGNKIGNTTLYSKNTKTNQFVYQDLLNEIDGAIESQNKKTGKKSKKATISALKEDLKNFKNIEAKLIDQIITQEEKIRILMLGNSKETREIHAMEDEIYIIGSLLNITINGAIPNLKKGIIKYMELHANSDRLNSSNKKIEIMINLINESKVIKYT